MSAQLTKVHIQCLARPRLCSIKGASSLRVVDSNLLKQRDPCVTPFQTKSSRCNNRVLTWTIARVAINRGKEVASRQRRREISKKSSTARYPISGTGRSQLVTSSHNPGLRNRSRIKRWRVRPFSRHPRRPRPLCNNSPLLPSRALVHLLSRSRAK